MSRSKGLADLAVLVIVAGIIIAVAMLFIYVPLLSKLVVIKAEERLLIKIEDDGSRLSMLMELDNGTSRYAEIVGGLRAKNASDHVSREYLESVLQLLNAKAAIYDERGNLIFGEQASETAEIALPGGLKGGMGLK